MPRLRNKAVVWALVFLALALAAAVFIILEQGARMRGYVPPLNYVIAFGALAGVFFIPMAVLMFLTGYRREIAAAMYENPKRWTRLFARQCPRMLARFLILSAKASIRPLVFTGLVILFVIASFWVIQSWNLSRAETTEVVETEVQKTAPQYPRETVLAVAVSSALAAYFMLRVLERIYAMILMFFSRRWSSIRLIISRFFSAIGRVPGMGPLITLSVRLKRDRAERRRFLFAAVIAAAAAGVLIGYFFQPIGSFVSSIFAGSSIVAFVFIGAAIGILIGAALILVYHLAGTRGAIKT